MAFSHTVPQTFALRVVHLTPVFLLPASLCVENLWEDGLARGTSFERIGASVPPLDAAAEEGSWNPFKLRHLYERRGAHSIVESCCV